MIKIEIIVLFLLKKKKMTKFWLKWFAHTYKGKSLDYIFFKLNKMDKERIRKTIEKVVKRNLIINNTL